MEISDLVISDLLMMNIRHAKWRVIVNCDKDEKGVDVAKFTYTRRKQPRRMERNSKEDYRRWTMFVVIDDDDDDGASLSLYASI